jgi:hypothetical protein
MPMTSGSVMVPGSSCASRKKLAGHRCPATP